MKLSQALKSLENLNVIEDLNLSNLQFLQVLPLTKIIFTGLFDQYMSDHNFTGLDCAGPSYNDLKNSPHIALDSYKHSHTIINQQLVIFFNQNIKEKT